MAYGSSDERLEIVYVDASFKVFPSANAEALRFLVEVADPLIRPASSALRSGADLDHVLKRQPRKLFACHSPVWLESIRGRLISF